MRGLKIILLKERGWGRRRGVVEKFTLPRKPGCPSALSSPQRLVDLGAEGAWSAEMGSPGRRGQPLH